MTHKKIYLAHFDKQIKYFTQKDSDAFADTLTYWRICLGIKEEPSQEETTLNTVFIRENYPMLTLKQIKLAIDMSITGQLPVKADIYGMGFAPLYIGKILSAFISYQTDVMNKIAEKKKQQDLEDLNNRAKEHRTYEQKVADIRKVITDYAKLIKTQDGFQIDFKSRTFNFLQRNKLGVLDANQMAELKEEAFKETEKEVSQGLMHKIQNSLNVNQKERERDQLMKNWGRHLYCKRFFANIPDVDVWMDSFSDHQVLPLPLPQISEPKNQLPNNSNQEQ